MVEFYCICEEWRKTIEEMTGIFMNAFLHGVKFHGPYFRFCPWCGKELKKVEEEKKG